jgi:hypothetical protein
MIKGCPMHKVGFSSLVRTVSVVLVAVGLAGCADASEVDMTDPNADTGGAEAVEAVTVGPCTATTTLGRNTTGVFARCTATCTRDGTLMLRTYVDKRVSGVWRDIAFDYGAGGSRTNVSARAQSTARTGTFRAYCDVTYTDDTFARNQTSREIYSSTQTF